MIQETLNIGMDSIVFIDDNAFERNLVRNVLTEIEIPELPDDPSRYLTFLQSCNLFETSTFVGSKSDRTAQYQAMFERKKLEMSFETIDDYLKSLEMKCEARSFEENQYSRIAQLTQRSNQFNLRTIRYTEEDIKRISHDNRYITLTCSLKDKFGDYGLVSIVIIKKISEKKGFVDTWLMSCRALKRGLEEFTVNKIMELCSNEGIDILDSEYIPTPKNSMVSNIYEEYGFKKINENSYSIVVSNYEPKNNYIKEEK